MDREDKIFLTILLLVVGGVTSALIYCNTGIRFYPGDHVYQKSNPNKIMTIMNRSINPEVFFAQDGQRIQFSISQDELGLVEETIDIEEPQQILHKGFEEGDVVKFKLDYWGGTREMVIGWFIKDRDAAACIWKDSNHVYKKSDIDLDLLVKVE